MVSPRPIEKGRKNRNISPDFIRNEAINAQYNVIMRIIYHNGFARQSCPRALPVGPSEATNGSGP